ncbi:MAG: hypothetical protein NTV97_33940 [Alphaproteobacteria bacterium]|nr:hypothetical protein [Alphaproteobacteria bacterium]
MSDFCLPSGTVVTATLFRPGRDSSGVGTMMLVCGDDRVDPATIVHAICLKGPELQRGLLEVLLPGPPVSLVLNFLLSPGVPASSVLISSVNSWPIDRAIRREDLVGRLVGQLALFVSRSFENLRRQLADRAMHADANAPAPATVQ